ncbi:BamA/TamA family outer membrane protein [Vibrio amylolyticus]|uniref:BamA/TamA family outer membrane protein n=1 Tax=Vibrio amylolyticus TaxID=2847292 RepID=UPI00355090BE
MSRWIQGVLVATFVLFASTALTKEKDSAFVPFFFGSETLGLSLGVAGVAKGVGQPQAALFGMGLYSDKDSYIGFLSAFNYALSENLLVSTQLYQAKLNQAPYYLGDQGDNDSDLQNKTIVDGFEENYQFEFKFLLPWGTVKDEGYMGMFKPQRDVSFASPMDSGVTSISFVPFYTSRKITDNFIDKDVAKGLRLTLDWDNRDSTRNPTKGSHSELTFTMGSDDWVDSEIWNQIEFQNSHYFSLGSLGSVFEQQVLALDFYTADTPSWNRCNDSQTCVRPPEHEQIRLGGLYRLRSYTGGRYHGRSAIHYSAEYRMIPEWQPLGDIPVINYYDLPWWQWVAFVDVGRVAEEYDLKTLHTDMQWSVGGAVRFQVEGIVVRAELARGTEESLFRVMINQPF